jgi:small subunit ribosomal protein S1
MEDQKNPAVESPSPATDQAPEESASQAPSAAAEQGVSAATAPDPSPSNGSSEASENDSTENDSTEAAPTEAPAEEAAAPGEGETTPEASEQPAPEGPEAEQAAPEGAEAEQAAPESAEQPAASTEAQAAGAAAAQAVADTSSDMEEMTMEDVLAASDEQLARKPVHRGMITMGEVIMLAQDGIIVDVGAKIEGLLPYNQLFEFDANAEEAAKYFKPGDEIQVYVVRSDIPNNTIILSKKRADQERAWNLLQEIHEAEKPVEVEIVEKVKGGLVANLGIRAFLPASQVDVRRVNDLSPFVGQRIRVKIIELNRRRNRVIISRRAILEEEIKEQKAETLKKLEPGVRMEGEVVEITDFGAFVNLGGIDGLVHRSELTHGRFNHPRDVVKVGDKVKVEVLDMDLERERINLSMKSLVANPWDDVLARYQIGERIAGKVTNLTQFGAFVEIEPGLEGLIHVSEMSWTKRIRHPKEVLSEGDEVEAMILKIDTNQQRISLGLRQTQPDPWSSLPDRYPPGTEITGPITGITDFGVFMEIEEGIEGLVHISELAHEHIENITDHFQRGDEITAVILNIDPVEQRASLSRKRLLPYTASSLDAMPTGAPAARGGQRKGRRGGRRSAEIDYDYSYAETGGGQSRTTTKLGDVYADLFAQFGLGEGQEEGEAAHAEDAPGAAASEPTAEAPAESTPAEPATAEAEPSPTEPSEAEAPAAEAAAPEATPAPEAAEAEPATQPEPAAQAEPPAPSDAETVAQPPAPPEAAAPQADAPASEGPTEPAEGEAEAREPAAEGEESAIDAAEAAAMLTAAFREGKRPKKEDEEGEDEDKA